VAGDQKHRYFGFENEAELKAAKAMGRVYDPVDDKYHNWDVNLRWLLGIIQRSRTVEINTPTSKEYIYREGRGETFSAFAREIATVMKAGYQTEFSEEGQLKLTPPLHDLSKLTLQDINPTKEETESAIQTVLLTTLEKISSIYGVEEPSGINSLPHLIDKLYQRFSSEFIPEGDSAESDDDRLNYLSIANTAYDITLHKTATYGQITDFFDNLNKKGFIYEGNTSKLKKLE
jgi:hypothetical protein